MLAGVLLGIGRVLGSSIELHLMLPSARIHWYSRLSPVHGCRGTGSRPETSSSG